MNFAPAEKLSYLSARVINTYFRNRNVAASLFSIIQPTYKILNILCINILFLHAISFFCSGRQYRTANFRSTCAARYPYNLDVIHTLQRANVVAIEYDLAL